jgi:hypothetical protein
LVRQPRRTRRPIHRLSPRTRRRLPPRGRIRFSAGRGRPQRCARLRTSEQLVFRPRRTHRACGRRSHVTVPPAIAATSRCSPVAADHSGVHFGVPEQLVLPATSNASRLCCRSRRRRPQR